MPDLHNHTDRPITASTRHCIPANGSLHVSADTMVRLGQEPYIARCLKMGELTVTADKAPEPEPLSRKTIAKAKRAELLEILDTHGVTAGTVENLTVDEVRELTARVVFMDL